MSHGRGVGSWHSLRDVPVSQWLCQGTFSPEGMGLTLLGLHGLGDVPCPAAGQNTLTPCSHSWATAWLLPAPFPGSG